MLKKIIIKIQSDMRYKKALLSVLANIFSKAVGVVLIIMSIRLTLPYLGSERYGVWVLISGLTTFLTLLDLGVGNSIPNRITYAIVNYKKQRLNKVIMGCLGVLVVISFASYILLTIILTIVPWNKVIQSNDITLINETKSSAKLFIILFSYNIIIGGVQRIHQSFQSGYIPHLISGIASSISILVLYIACLNEANVPTLILSTFGVQCIINSTLLFLIPFKFNFNKKIIIWIKIEYKKIINNSKLFFLMQIGQLVGWGADNIIISWNLGTASVAMFSVAVRLFQLISLPLLILNAPLWTAYADAHHKSDNHFLKNTFQISFITTLISSIFFGGIIVLFYQQIVEFLTKDTIKVIFSLIFAYYILSILEALGNSVSMYLNGTNQISMQVKATLIFVVIGLPLKMIAVNYGLTIFIFGTIIAFVIAVPIYYSLFYRAVFAKLV